MPKRSFFAALSLALAGVACASCPRAGTTAANAGGAASTTSGVDVNAIPIRIDAEGRAFAREQALYKSEDYSKIAGDSQRAAPGGASAVIDADPTVPHGRVLAVV